MMEMTGTEQFIIQLATLVLGFVVTVVTLIVNHRSQSSQLNLQSTQLDHVSKAVNGIPGEPTVKQQTAIIQDTIRKEVLPRIADTNDAVHDAAGAAKIAADKAETAAALLSQTKEGC